MRKLQQTQNFKKKESSQAALWQSEQYAIYPDRVVQQEFTAQAVSITKITSNYHSPTNEFLNPRLIFKFCLNGQDNEMPFGVDHQFTCLPQNGTCETPLITFGEPLKNTAELPVNSFLTPNTKLKIRLDLRPVLAAFESPGFYTCFNGHRIYKADFKSVFVAGNVAPLTWDFDKLVHTPELELKEINNSGIYEVTLLLNPDQEEQALTKTWQLSRDVSSYPQYTSDYPLLNALYNLHLQEMLNAIEADNTFRTGQEWAGVWTRDISYSIILSMAMLQPQVAQNSLLQKVTSSKRIVQDTGTGGAYPISSDRVVWVIAAWEIYKANQDRAWLQEVYLISKNSLEDDLKNTFNPESGLFRGESSFLDWREQSYPAWMQPADIYESECLGTNAVFYRALVILAQMADLLHEQPAARKYQQIAENLKNSINQHLWLPEKGYYAQYRYGRHFKIISPRAEALGEALCVLFNVANLAQQQTLVANTPVTAFGISCIYPQTPHISPYHNNGIWPFVQAYWLLACAKAGNEQALAESMAAFIRPAALFLTNKENFVASNGDFAGTQINSDNMLWSLAGSLSMVYQVIFGITFKSNELLFKPIIPEIFKGKHQLTNFKYLNATLDIDVEGFGNKIKTITLDGKPLTNATIPANLTGKHLIKIELANNQFAEKEINKVPFDFSPATPVVAYHAGILSWQKVEGAVLYAVLQNGQIFKKTTDWQVPVPVKAYAEYQVIAHDAQGHESFASEPFIVAPEEVTQIYQLEQKTFLPELDCSGFSGSGFAEISTQENKNLKIAVTAPETGVYALDFRYANGEGPINTSNKCAFRTLKKDELQVGTLVFPQRGFHHWSDWGYSNAVKVKLDKGTHQLALTLDEVNRNMHGEVNRAILDYLRVIKMSD
ncbi:glycogen debranching protein [Adhaeribacter swui]|uniref:Glycogen debranching protein n=1 Tax=Adhaeribacter swui TaxID=2086471 RepID=A0A7G7G4B7_9BACT|nr:trehalase family glycosidase [Adhaeribacter swui]QNF32001.1 glycogen debranching protein [Adhaeribacter swui]